MRTRPGKILIIDDHLELALNVSEILELEGYDSVVAGSAEEALEIFEREDFAAIITDFRLPGATGAQLIAEVRRRGSGIPAVVVSAYTDPETIDAAERAGAFEVLPKPIDIARLTGVLKAFEQSAVGVLIVEDNQPLAENLAEALAARGFKSTLAPTVSEALAHGGRPAAAIVDYRLPDGTGISVADELAARNPRLRILFVTGYHEELTAQLSQRPGAEFLRKPIDLPQLLRWVEQALPRLPLASA